jgi:hypothetical protein
MLIPGEKRTRIMPDCGTRNLVYLSIGYKQTISYMFFPFMEGEPDWATMAYKIRIT